MRYILATILCFLFFGSSQNLNGQSSHKLLQKGDSHYKANDFAQAEENYRKAREKDNSLKANYNLGNTTYELERYEESVDSYIDAISRAESKEEESMANYNLGNSYFQVQDLQNAIDAYKQAIRLDPKNKEAQYNLAVSKEILKMQQQQEQQQQQENSDQQNENGEEGEQQEQQESEEGEGENQSEPDSTQQIESAFDSSRLEKQNLDSIDAMKLLQIIQSEEQKVQEKLRKFNSNRKKPDKDW